jgi:hypothetical protein
MQQINASGDKNTLLTVFADEKRIIASLVLTQVMVMLMVRLCTRDLSLLTL